MSDGLLQLQSSIPVKVQHEPYLQCQVTLLSILQLDVMFNKKINLNLQQERRFHDNRWCDMEVMQLFNI